jgi:hypothetical protein
VIVAVPVPTAVTVIVAPLALLTDVAELTVKTAVLLDTQLTVRPESVLLPASFGVAVRICVFPRTIGVVGAESVTVATGTGFTTIDGVVEDGALSLVAVIVAAPVPTAVIVIVAPLALLTDVAELTVSTDGLLDTQLTVRPDNTVPPASFGNAVSCCVAPTIVCVEGAESVTDATGTGFTVISGDGAEIDSLVAVIVAVPRPTAVTVAGDPLALTVRTEGLLETQVTVRPVRVLLLASLVVAVSCWA